MTCQASELISEINLNILKIIFILWHSEKIENSHFGGFFSEGTKKNAKTGKEFGIEGKKIDLWTPANQF